MAMIPPLRVHFVRCEPGTSDQPYAVRHLHAAPRVGETLRFAPALFFKVTAVIWPLDEPDYEPDFQRVNVGIELES